MKTVISAIISVAFAAFTAAHADQASLDILQDTQIATNSGQNCAIKCSLEHSNPYDKSQCYDECTGNQQGSLEVMPRLTGETQVAVSDCSVECRFEHEDNYGTCLANCQANQQGSVGGTGAITRFASSIRLGDPQPICGTDAWACFNGTDDESPMIRDVGIFGVFASNHPCMHPSCD